MSNQTYRQKFSQVVQIQRTQGIHVKGFDYKPFIAPHRSRELHTLLDIGPLTITEIRTKNGEIAYKMKARTMKYARAEDLRKILRTFQNELIRLGIYKDNRNHESKRRYYAANRDAINAKRRAKRAAQKVTKQAMQELPTRI